MEKSISRMMTDLKNNNNLDNYQIALQLKYILEKNLSINEFTKWFCNTTNKLRKYEFSNFLFFTRLQFLKTNSNLCTKFFNYLNTILNKTITTTKFSNLKDQILEIKMANKLGPIAFVAPELGRWSTVGGLGIMVDELSQGLVELGEDVIMISPYYERNRKGETGYLSRDPVEFKYVGNIEVMLDVKYSLGVHFGICNGVKLYFLHNYEIFPSPYAEGSNSFVLKQISLFSKAALELLCFINTIPAVILTNDWFSGLTAAYSKYGHFGETFKGTTFFHIIHNLEAGYEGRIYPTSTEGTMEHIHKLPPVCLIDPQWKSKIINPSRCALICSDQWGTVSPSYRRDLMEGSAMAHLLRNFSQPFAFPNGIFREQRLKALQSKAGSSREEAKKQLQIKYFGYKDADYTIPLYSFVGRLTLQKGVLLILDAVETLINKSQGKINILVGGMGNMKDPYVIQCVNKINYLKSQFPHNFWANPSEFFTDGPLVNMGSDFGLMPSLFEPGGIVQHEFFIAGTPVIAFKTGGLKDTVVEFEWFTNKGNGILFEHHGYHDFVNAVERSLHLFANEEKFQICRKNAYNSAIDVIDVAKAWNREFYRLRGKLYYHISESESNLDQNIFSESLEQTIDSFNEKDYAFLDEKFDEVIVDNEINNIVDGQLQRRNSQSTLFEGESRIPITIIYSSDEKLKPTSVQVCGSFDKWQVRHPLILDPLSNKWTVTLKIKKGTYFFKFIVDGEWQISKSEKIIKDSSGFINNIITI